jgi:hypothetical protein
LRHISHIFKISSCHSYRLAAKIDRYADLY